MGVNDAAPFIFTLFTDDPSLAAAADAAGVDRIGVDLDQLGKAARQGPAYRISRHEAKDLNQLRGLVGKGRLFARTDPLHADSQAQIDELIDFGADVLMLPMFSSAEDARAFVRMVRGRASVSLLVETVPAALDIASIVGVEGVDEVFVGLNDLHLSLGARSRFHVLVSDLMSELAATVCASGIRFGLGGVGRVDDSTLPVPSRLVYPQLPRLGATSTILARSFFAPDAHGPVNLRTTVAASRAELARLSMLSPEELEESRLLLERHLCLEVSTP